MKIAYFVYPSAFQNPGGGEIVLQKVEEYVKRTGVDVRRFDIWNDRVEEFDILHVFGSVKDCLGLMEVARSRGVKVALESIFWSDFRRAFFEEGSWLKKTDKVMRHAVKVLFPAFPSSRRKMFQASDMIMPNSDDEARQISRLFSVPMDKMFVVPNGVDASFALAGPDAFVKKYGLRDFVLSVGRIEPRKNQLNLIRAMKGSAKDLVIIGDTVSGYEWYFDSCVKEAEGGNVRFLGGMDHGSGLLASAYAAASVFVLPGWFETPGLAALEAALAGAKVVATRGGSTREYFGDKVLYCRPESPEDMRDKIEKALKTGLKGDLKSFVLDNYTWEKVAEKTVEGYRKLLGS